ncbi:UDP-glycosyltransferase UGT5-like [Pieris brassicae]|uniref:UDP-glycosyltransferase UGT5-like n=1 Tax=Pieris brassicae TaxID=7116 RepID=UPI001E660342|nr:UDP-glycosyltransferase UGT5-like [Pieris brassicae]XP_045517772.1 UDP-glycosyltransferase UGT5-like [Pieris brassicae]
MKCVILWILFLNACTGYRVLLVFPFPFESHGIFGEGFVRHLINAGHEVTYVTPFPINNTNPKLHQIEVTNDNSFKPFLNLKDILERNMRHEGWKLFLMMKSVAEKTALNVKVQALLNDTSQKFDVAVVEWMDHDIYSGFSAVFECPFIWFFPYDQYIEIFRLIHTPPNPAYTPNMRTINLPPFTFIQRVQELWYTIVTLFKRHFLIHSFEEEIYSLFFEPAMKKRGKELPAYSDVKYNASLAFSGSHISLRDVPEVPSSLKMIGGFNINTHIEPLPEDLQKLMDRSKEGVILFSMGTQLTFGGLSNLVTELVNIFSKLKYTVLWKTNEGSLALPSNVIAKKWIPQVSVLAHPNCILFITHGGLLSMTEAVHFGVPIIGLPAFADQFINVRSAVINGFAKEVKLSVNMGNELLLAINDVTNDPRYRTRAKEISRIYHSRVVPPGVELVHWIEEVVTSRGAPHLRSPALTMPLYQKYYLDLAATILIIPIIMYLTRNLIYSLRKSTLKNKKND